MRTRLHRKGDSIYSTREREIEDYLNYHRVMPIRSKSVTPVALSSEKAEFDSLLRDCLQSHDERALDVFFSKVRPYLAALLIASFPQDVGIVEDALHSAVVKFLKILRRRAPGSIRSVNYFVVIAKNCLVDELRRRRGSVRLDELTHLELLHKDEGPKRTEAQVIVLAAMLRLDKRTRFVLESYYIQERSSKDIADDLGVAHESIYTILKRSRDYFREVVGHGGGAAAANVAISKTETIVPR
jgi:RNA polymerase sigma factor (sigma-70 family)